MPIRIEIELTSASPDGSWTWRAAGARQPRGVLDGSILPGGAAVGDQLKVETEQDIEGTRVLSVVPAKDKGARNDLLELLPSEAKFEPVTEQRAPGGRRRDDDRGGRGPRRDRPGGDRRGGPGGDRRGGPGGRRDDRPGGERGPSGDRRGEGRPGGDRPGGDRRDHRSNRPHFTPPPEVPQRPKPKRLRPGKQHRADVLASLPEEQRPVAELALQGIAAVRQRLREDNARLRAEDKPEMPEAAVMKMAEELLPRLRLADWLDRADAAKRQMEHLDLRDLRSVVASADDPSVARDEATRDLVIELKAALVTKQEEELTLWLSDVEAALEVGRVVRALRLSSQPPKAGVPFPPALAGRLGEATTVSLQPTDAPDRWIAVLEAAAFSPVRTLVTPAAAPEQRSDELLATVKRLGPLLPQIAALLEVEVPANAHVPKPLRPTTRKPAAKATSPGPKPAPKPRAAAAPEQPAPDAASTTETTEQPAPDAAADVPDAARPDEAPAPAAASRDAADAAADVPDAARPDEAPSAAPEGLRAPGAAAAPPSSAPEAGATAPGAEDVPGSDDSV